MQSFDERGEGRYTLALQLNMNDSDAFQCLPFGIRSEALPRHPSTSMWRPFVPYLIRGEMNVLPAVIRLDEPCSPAKSCPEAASARKRIDTAQTRWVTHMK